MHVLQCHSGYSHYRQFVPSFFHFTNRIYKYDMIWYEVCIFAVSIETCMTDVHLLDCWLLLQHSKPKMRCYTVPMTWRSMEVPWFLQSHLILSPTPLKCGIDVGIGAGPVWCLSGWRSVEPVVNRMYTCCFRRSSSLVGFQTFVGRWGACRILHAWELDWFILVQLLAHGVLRWGAATFAPLCQLAAKYSIYLQTCKICIIIVVQPPFNI